LLRAAFVPLDDEEDIPEGAGVFSVEVDLVLDSGCDIERLGVLGVRPAKPLDNDSYTLERAIGVLA
jgi:hypothetical protein